jgi:hypothetical protein
LRFIGRQFGESWFSLDRNNEAVRFVMSRAHTTNWLQFSAFRVQAFLELPFVIFAYLSIGWLLGQRAYRAITNPVMLILASVSYSIALICAELALRNRFTTDDVYLRIAACVTVPMYTLAISRLTNSARRDEDLLFVRPPSFFGILLFLVGGLATAYLVLVAYDVFLLYNLRQLGSYSQGILIAAITAFIAIISLSLNSQKLLVPMRQFPSVIADFYHHSLVALVVFFFVPALPLRYLGVGIVGGSRETWLVAGGALLAIACGTMGYGSWQWYAERSSSPYRRKNLIFLSAVVLISSSMGAIIGVKTASTTLGRARVTEMGLLWCLGAAFFAVLICSWSADQLIGRRMRLVSRSA